MNRAQCQAVRARLLEAQAGQFGVQLRALYRQELCVATVIALITLNAEVRRHGIKALVWGQQFTLTRINGADIANREATFRN